LFYRKKCDKTQLFHQKDGDKILDRDEALIYLKEERDRVRTIIYEQIR